MINPEWFEPPMFRTIFYGPKDFWVIEVRLYIWHERNLVVNSDAANEKYEPAHDKTNKMTCAPSEDSDQPRHPPSLISLCYLCEESLGP